MPKDKKAEGEDVDVVPSNQAINTVAGWLGISADQAFKGVDGWNDGSSRSDPSKRSTKYLGLGASYVPHHKAVGFAAAIDDRLKKRLERGAKRKAALSLEERDEEQASTHDLHHNLASAQQHGQGFSQKRPALVSDGSDDSDEEKGKAAQLRKGPLHHAADGSGGLAEGKPVSATPKLSSKAEREAQLFGGYTAQQVESGEGMKKKKNKKKKKKGAATRCGRMRAGWLIDIHVCIHVCWLVNTSIVVLLSFCYHQV